MRQLNHLAFALLFSGSLNSSIAQAGEEGSKSERDGSQTVTSAAFIYGGECTQLSRLGRHEIAAVTHAVHSDSYDRFCVAHGVYSCADYSSLLRGAGTLEENDSFGCNFVPAAR